MLNNFYESYGQTITKAMAEQGLSNRSAARLCGVSRRHLSVAQKGGNVSIALLVKIMTALHITEVWIGPDARVRSGIDDAAASPMIALAADHVEKAARLAQTAAAILRTLSPAGTVEIEADNSDLILRASNLIQNFTDHVRTAVAAGKPLAPMERAMSATLSDSDVSTTPAAEPAATRKRKKSA
jgi:transcriptional regulator with XRE-family HTH domain